MTTATSGTGTSGTGLSVVRAAGLLATHLTGHGLPEPVSLIVTTGWEQVKVSAQLPCATVPEVAGDLLAWINTLGTVTVQAWRPPEGDRVHLSIAAILADLVDAVELNVFAGAKDDPALFADLNPGERRAVSLDELRGWTVPATASPVPEAPEAQR
ncbi:MAG TPA: hypothetical protein VFO16_21225 [Pseudonocardiaceae bacterium]|nr:hypothetical protein [Pseudonocardiaceae bacterium]